MAQEPVTVGAFVRALRWLAPLSVGTMLVLWLFDVKGMRDLGLGGAVLLGLGFVVVLGPLVWLRWEHWGRHDRSAWLFLAGAMVWAGVSLAAVVGVLALFDVD